ncbi:MAG: cyclic nucleotide-binding domain-containing protein [Proteobacteria bacterium]|nr:cyclic nucleotide-binding domain-containing protein [Pseudomonadota bacterium]
MNPRLYQDFTDVESILIDTQKFCTQLQLDSDSSEFLSNHKSLQSLVNAINKDENYNLSQIFSRLNGLGQLSFSLMVISQISGWSSGVSYPLKQEKIRSDKLFSGELKTIPNRSRLIELSLLGSIAWNFLEWMIFPGLKIAYADGDFSINEREAILEFFESRWGFKRMFLERIIRFAEDELVDFEYPVLAKNFSYISKEFPEINAEEVKGELFEFIRSVVSADGIVHPSEEKEIIDLENSFQEVQDEAGNLLINNLWDNIFSGYRKQKEISVTKLLYEVPLFANLTRWEIRTVARIIHRRNYKTGEYLFLKDDPGAAMFIIKTGAIKIVVDDGDGQEMPLATLRPGSFVGELALLDNSPRSASARAIESTEGLAFFRSEFNRLLKTHPSIGGKIIRELAIIIGQRLKATNEQLYKK